MTDFEYRVKRLVEAVQTGDVNALELLADECGIAPLKVSSELLLLMDADALRESIMRSFGLPPSLVGKTGGAA